MKIKYPELTKDALSRMYWVEGKSLAEIGKAIGCSSSTIHRNMKKFGIKTRGASEAHRNPSEEIRRKISEAEMGAKNHNYGKHRSEETRRKISERHKGKHLPEETRRKISEAEKGKKNHNYGKHFTEETRKKLSETHKGEKCYNWQGGISYAPYCSKFNFSLKERIREKYGRECFLCGKTEQENGKKLDIHHVDNDKMQGCEGKRFLLVPLCRSCHMKIHQNKKLNRRLLGKLNADDHRLQPKHLCNRTLNNYG